MVVEERDQVHTVFAAPGSRKAVGFDRGLRVRKREQFGEADSADAATADGLTQETCGWPRPG